MNDPHIPSTKTRWLKVLGPLVSYAFFLIEGTCELARTVHTEIGSCSGNTRIRFVTFITRPILPSPPYQVSTPYSLQVNSHPTYIVDLKEQTLLSRINNRNGGQLTQNDAGMAEAFPQQRASECSSHLT